MYECVQLHIHTLFSEVAERLQLSNLNFDEKSLSKKFNFCPKCSTFQLYNFKKKSKSISVRS